MLLRMGLLARKDEKMFRVYHRIHDNGVELTTEDVVKHPDGRETFKTLAKAEEYQSAIVTDLLGPLSPEGGLISSVIEEVRYISELTFRVNTVIERKELNRRD